MGMMERKEAKKKREELKEEITKAQIKKKQDDILWNDNETEKKIKKQQEKKQKDLEKNQAIKEKNQLYEEEMNELQKNKKIANKYKKDIVTSVKKANDNLDQKLKEKYSEIDTKIVSQHFPVSDNIKKVEAELDNEFQDLYKYNSENIENEFMNITEIDDAINKMTLGDKHPEKRIKKAFAIYLESHESKLKKSHPTMNRNQRMNLLWNEFQSSNSNPINNNNNFNWNK